MVNAFIIRAKYIVPIKKTNNFWYIITCSSKMYPSIIQQSKEGHLSRRHAMLGPIDELADTSATRRQPLNRRRAAIEKRLRIDQITRWDRLLEDSQTLSAQL